MTFWQENYPFIKDVYIVRNTKMTEWMENVEKSISRILADKVYTSAEFKRERDNFHALIKDLERAEVKKWLQQILEILMAERGKEERSEQVAKLEACIEKHENLIPTVSATTIKVDLYWKCYAYGDELTPYIEFLDGIMMSSTRDVAPSCIENVEELIERQEKSISQLDSKKVPVKDLIDKGKILLGNPDKPKFLDGHVRRIEVGWDDTKEKATTRLKLLTNTKAAWEGYAIGLETIAEEFEKAEEEIKKVKKRFNLQAACDDLAARQKIYNDTNKTITGMHDQLNHNYDVMTMTLPEDKKDHVKKEIKAVTEKLTVLNRFEEKVKKIEEFVEALKNFDSTLKDIDSWMKAAETQLDDVKNKSDKMTPEDRVTQTMDLLEDIHEKVDVLLDFVKQEEELLPQGDSVPKDAQDYKDELGRIKKYVDDLYSRTGATCIKFSEDVTFWAQYKTGIKIFSPWLSEAEQSATGGLSKPQTLDEANAMFGKVQDFDNACLKHLAILEGAAAAANEMTTHKEADDEVKALKERYVKVKVVSDEWMKKADTLVKEWKLLDNTVNELNSWIGADRGAAQSESNFSLEKMESTLGELKNIFKQKELLVENL